jgi:uncharacterized protein YceH (UPF0502 family)
MAHKQPAPLTAIERRILGVLIEKARTTPDTYPLSMNALVTGCNQKSNRAPLMNLTEEQVEDAVIAMRQKQLIAEIHGGGRVAKFRHYGYDYMGVKGVEAGVMTELLLRGEQTAGELRTRASRFDAIADLTAMNQILDSLIQRELVIALTPAGRGQLFSHNLYEPHELESLKASLAGYTGEDISTSPSSSSAALANPPASRPSNVNTQELERLSQEVRELRALVQDLQQRVTTLES